MSALSLQSTPSLDRFAIGLSGLCAAHCIASAVLLTLLTTMSSLTMMLASPIIHETGFVLAMVLGALALLLGARRHGLLLPVAVGSLGLGVMAGALSLPHGGGETAYTLFGVLILAFGHHLNSRAAG